MNGAPVKLTDPERVSQQIDEYFESLRRFKHVKVYDPDHVNDDGSKGGEVWKEIEDDPKMPGMAGLAYALGMSRSGLWRFMEREAEPDSDADLIQHEVSRAKARIEMMHESGLFDRETYKGSEFSLRVNSGWSETVPATQGGGKFVRQLTPPAPAQDARAIPKWNEE